MDTIFGAEFECFAKVMMHGEENFWCGIKTGNVKAQNVHYGCISHFKTKQGIQKVLIIFQAGQFPFSSQ